MLGATYSSATVGTQSQAIQATVASQVSWGSANGCQQNTNTNDFGQLTPSAGQATLGSFGATPAAQASTNSAGKKVWVGCITTNTTLASVVAQGSADMKGGADTLPLADVSIGLTNAADGLLNGGGAGCTIEPGQTAAGDCTLPTGDTGDTLLTDAEPGTTELDWQYQLDLPANQAVGVYTGGEVTFTAVAEESAARQPAGMITEYALPRGSEPFRITSGPAGDLWFSEEGTEKIGRITPAGVITEYALEHDPVGVAAGPDGNLWFADLSDSKIGRITTSGTITEYPLPSESEPDGITAGPDGNLWFTDSLTSKVGKITTTGQITEYALPKGSDPVTITAGPDGNLWFADDGTNRVGKITTAGQITEYALPIDSDPRDIAAGPDGNLWFTDYDTKKVGKITTSGQITEYRLPVDTVPHQIAAGPHGELWFTDWGIGGIASITTNGTVTEYHVPSESEPDGIALGPDGDMWFVEYSGDKVGKIVP